MIIGTADSNARKPRLRPADKDMHGLMTAGLHVLSETRGTGKLVVLHASLHASMRYLNFTLLPRTLTPISLLGRPLTTNIEQGKHTSLFQTLSYLSANLIRCRPGFLHLSSESIPTNQEASGIFIHAWKMLKGWSDGWWKVWKSPETRFACC